jgi:predicted MPP superfamily phosphohydrolase
MAPGQAAKQQFVRSLSRYEPDLIVDTGDNLGHLDGNAGLEYALEPFAGVPGVFVHGSNDFFGPVFKNPLRYFVTLEDTRQARRPDLDTAGMVRFFEDRLGWLDLNNAARAIEVRGTRLELFGTNDAHRDWDRLDLLPGAIEAVRENVTWSDESGDQVLAIGVTHAPYRRVLDDFVNQGADLVLAGHTHGGQVRIPGLPALVTNCDIPADQAQGLSRWRSGSHDAYLNVSAGIGTSIYAPFRFACPPEAVVLTLVAR